MSSFAIPPLPGENLLNVETVARRADCSRSAVYNAIHDGKLAAVQAAGRVLIAESEAERFIREWPTRTRPDVASRWREYRAWKRAQRAGSAA